MKRISLLLAVILIAGLFSACAPRSSVGIIGGADGPTAIFTSKEAHAPALSPEEALTIALSHAGVTADSVHAHTPELELDDGVLQYEVEFHNGIASYSYEINADTGDILSFEKEG